MRYWEKKKIQLFFASFLTNNFLILSRYLKDKQRSKDNGGERKRKRKRKEKKRKNWKKK